MSPEVFGTLAWRENIERKNMKLNKTKYPLRQLLGWLWRNHKRCRTQAIINVSVGVVQVALSLLSVEVLRRLTDVATGKMEGSLVWLAVAFGVIMLLEMGCNIVLTWIRAVLGVKAQNQLQQQFFARLLKGQWNGVERFHSGDVLNRLFGDVNDIISLLTEVTPNTVIILLQFVASLTYLMFMDWQLGVILLVVTPLFVLLSRYYFHRMRRIVRHIKDSYSSLQAIIQETVQHKMVVKVLEQGDGQVDKLERRQRVLRWQIKSRAKFSILSKMLVNIGFSGGYLVGLTYGLFQLKDGFITVGVLMAFTQLIGRIQRPLLDMARTLPTLVNSMTSVERLMELEELPMEPQLEPHPMTGRVGIRFTDVDYKYADNGRNVLHHFSHDFRPGSFTAILGETGAGKTTLIRLMLSLIKPENGKVELYQISDADAKIAHFNGENTTNGAAKNAHSIGENGGAEEKRKSLETNVMSVDTSTRCNFSYVPQGNTLFSGTVRENLRFGNPAATAAQMKEALHLAMADFVLELPDGLDTKCGEGGGGLSEGQAQRIAIARAILRPCRILLLDEATSALDIATEHQLLERLKAHFTDTTIIFVTHRLAVADFTTEQLTMERNPA